ncbi:V-type ATPase subunit [Oryzomonas sagensis]|uniref:V-type ATPase subunit n=1 Tax=Oryzomonas sagensis TaxID=2603857 RepID=A0ABQ6TKE4_9BACT|nr:V-type ATPase subunit [Oryzomonas sagensis]KAB0668281.1 V-type ATPase subunit [Oryzomonas sagensis]
MGLLAEHGGSGVPLPYLLARVMGRRAYLVTDWQRVLAAAEPLASLPPSPYRQDPEGGADEGLWGGLQREFAWVHRQMGHRLQEIFEPFFLTLELRTLFMALRLRFRGEEGRSLADLLRFSLLCAPVKRLLSEGEDLPAILAGVGAHASFWPDAGRALPEILRHQGMRGCEEQLVDAGLEHAAARRLHPAVSLFVTRLIDLENFVALAKQVRWRMGESGFVAGGSIGVALLREAARDREGGKARRLAARVLGMELDPTAAELVPLLAARLGLTLRRQGREPDGVGLILDYLWRRLTETRNLSLLLHGSDLERETLGREMVL